MTVEAEVIAQVAEHAAGEVVADILAEANERADERGALAEVIADAALENERGRVIAEIQEGLGECRNTLAELSNLLGMSLAEQMNLFRAEIQTTLEATRADCLSAVADALANLAMPIRPVSQSELTPPLSTEEIQPDHLIAPAPEPDPAPAPAPRRKNLFR